MVHALFIITKRYTGPLSAWGMCRSLCTHGAWGWGGDSIYHHPNGEGQATERIRGHIQEATNLVGEHTHTGIVHTATQHLSKELQGGGARRGCTVQAFWKGARVSKKEDNTGNSDHTPERHHAAAMHLTSMIFTNGTHLSFLSI